MIHPPDLITIQEFCDIANVSRTHTYALLKQGKLTAIKDGRSTKIPRSSYEAWKSSLPVYQSQTSIQEA